MDIRLAIQLLLIFTSLLSITFSFRYYVHYRVLVLNRPFQQEENRRRYRIALQVLVFSVIVFLVVLIALVSGADRARQMPANPALTETPSVQQTQAASPGGVAPPTPVAPPEVQPAATATPAALVRLARIGNTNGFGANLRTAPGVAAEIIATLMDDTQVRLTDAIQEAGGYTWHLVVLDNGLEGWVADIYLIPED